MHAVEGVHLPGRGRAAYGEGELERKPLRERGDGDDGPPQGTDPTPEPQAAERDEDSSPTADWIGEDLETNRASMEQGLGTELENVFPDDGGEKTAPVETQTPAYSDW